ncbi:arginine/serine-rich coiled-coil protein 2 isoform X2 [Coccinella septempunctata]|uniref:arginine/serine-rich coiled-coil protein 2 isoform X2 n=1 Tax=Coccinella septempunctata TaxID=41139 RepID=UPI001D08C9BE|nr:arginine/serine-rich coiled-coil protein 2 isoform X2 [Coccinella septempunctata]
MDSLANYGSDDDYEDSSDEQQKDWPKGGINKKDSHTKQPHRSENQADANYEEVQMDLSEESNDGSRNGKDSRDKSSGDERRRSSPSDDKYREDHRSRRGENRYRDRSRSRDKRDEDRTRDKKDDRYGSKTDRYSRDYRRDSYRDRKSRRSTSRERRRSSSRERKRSSSRERRYSRSPKRDRSRRSRSRSRSRGRYGGPPRRYGYPKSNGSRNEASETSADNQSGKDRFFMPGITGKYRDQIEKRKLLWQKKDPSKQQDAAPAQGQSAPPPASTSRVTKIWEATTFAQDQDGKVASKFKRLMGIKGQTDTAPVPPVDIIKKQEEMFSSMEQQYEVARTATHTMRGVGLGFSSNYPR